MISWEIETNLLQFNFMIYNLTILTPCFRGHRNKTLGQNWLLEVELHENNNLKQTHSVQIKVLSMINMVISIKMCI